MELKHTPEPWHSDALYILIGQGDAEVEVAYTNELEDATRIVACVNACAGMEDPAVEIKSMRGAIKRLTEEIVQIGADRKRLIEALKESTDTIFWSNETGDKSMIRIVNLNKQLLSEIEARK